MYPRNKREYLRKNKLGRGCPLLQAGFQSLLEKVRLRPLDDGEAFWVAQTRAGPVTGKPGNTLRYIKGALTLGGGEEPGLVSRCTEPVGVLLGKWCQEYVVFAPGGPQDVAIGPGLGL